MEQIYLILVVVLFALAISDLIVGVSNDAVNFLNSAIGAKVASFKVIITIAAIGILVGATFSSGMMEVARKGIFHPQEFYFSEIMIIFLAVMITDVILLDLFNTFGLPTSTTVSIVFELLGSAVAVATTKVVRAGNSISEISHYINSDKALAIISGILLSVVVAFTVGAFVMYIARILFTFNYKKKIKYYGSIYGGVAIAVITYFILIKGAKGASFMTDESKDFIKHNSLMILGISFVGWTLILQILNWLFKLDILKFIVLVGTFALAMAFAGNDLVNFIGVPLAGFESFKSWIANPGADPDMFLMSSLQEKVKTPTYFLLIAGSVMVATLYLSKKARSVVKTSLDLSRQNEGEERFGSSLLARSIVRGSINMSKAINTFIPTSIKKGLNKRFDQTEYLKSLKAQADAPSFDMMRASVNLIVASILIAFATSLKLPLSTTYVTFMVAMGTSLTDKAWGRESAVYRITGVFSVIGGWFLTALSAFTVAFLVAMLISWAGLIGIIILLIIAAFLIYRTHVLHKTKTEETKKETIEETEIDSSNLIERCSMVSVDILKDISKTYSTTIDALIDEKRNKLHKTSKNIKSLNKKLKKLKNNINITINKLKDDSIETGHYYVQALDYLREMGHSMSFITDPAFNHVDNNHTGLIDEQVKELNQLKDDVVELFHFSSYMINNEDFDNIQEVIEKQKNILLKISEYRKNQVKRIRKNITGTKNSMLYLEIMNETKNLVLHTINMLKSNKDFVDNNEDTN